jgi:hypothetical protein
MTYDTAEIRGRLRLVDDAAPTVPLGTMSRDGGTLVARTAKDLGALSDRAISVKEFGAVGDGVTNDAAAIQLAIDYALETDANTIRFPAGTYRYATTIATHVDNFTILGDGVGRTNLIFAGSGAAIDADFADNGATPGLRFSLSGIKLNAENASGTGATHGIRIKHTGTTTSEGHSIRDVEVVGFTGGAGIQLSNVEHSLVENAHLYGNGTGLAMDNAGHSNSSSQGISNTCINVRCHANTGEGFDIQNQSTLTAITCQAIHNTTTGGATSGQFRVRGTCTGVVVTNLDIENGNNSNAGNGLSLSGNHHTVSTNAAGLAQGIRCASCSNSIFLDQRNAGTVSAGLLLDSTSNDNHLVNTGYQISDSGSRNSYARVGLVSKVAAYTLVPADDVVLADATSGAYSVTLLAASRVVAGRTKTIKKTDSSGNAVTVVGTIDGATNYTLASQNKYVVVVSDGTSWYIVGAN